MRDSFLKDPTNSATGMRKYKILREKTELGSTKTNKNRTICKLMINKHRNMWLMLTE
jgi:hypothetical protein